MAIVETAMVQIEPVSLPWVKGGWRTPCESVHDSQSVPPPIDPKEL
jgi:hypothetical protein